MSPLALLGALGTVLSTLSRPPHLAHALRHRTPSGTAFAWGFGTASSGVWFAYGFASGEIVVAAPGFVTIPVGLGLAAWCVWATRNPARAVTADVPPVAALRAAEGSVAGRMLPACDEDWSRSGDTLEMPRIVA